MSTYKQAGVNIEQGDKASHIAYQHAKTTFSTRNNLFGQPVKSDGAYAGLIDMGDFYLVQNDDGIGTKSIVATKMQKYDTLGYDLLCMVADDAICVGAEVISITNTIDTNKINPDIIDQMMSGLAKACQEQKILIPGGEIAELPDLINGITWNAAAVGVVSKDKLIDGSAISENDSIIALPSHNFRSNGLSLARFVLKNKYGDNWHTAPYDNKTTWGMKILEPSVIYHDTLLQILGRHQQTRILSINGIAHITGGGIALNLQRILKKNGLGAKIKIPASIIPEPMQKLIEIGNIKPSEAQKTWNMGIAHLLITNQPKQLIDKLTSLKISAHIIGTTTTTNTIEIEQ